MEGFETYAAELIFGRENAPVAALVLTLAVKIVGYVVVVGACAYSWLKASIHVVGRTMTWHSGRIEKRQVALAETIRRVVREETRR